MSKSDYLVYVKSSSASIISKISLLETLNRLDIIPNYKSVSGIIINGIAEA
jgi:hypothetical protein